MTLKVHCPECRGQFQVDGEESRSRFDCPFCSAPFRFQDKQTVVLSSSPLTEVLIEKIENPSEPSEVPPTKPPVDTSAPTVAAPESTTPTGSSKPPAGGNALGGNGAEASAVAGAVPAKSRPRAAGTKLESVAPIPRRSSEVDIARLKGYEGDPCPECQQLTLVRNGTCLRCDSCGATTGCS